MCRRKGNKYRCMRERTPAEADEATQTEQPKTYGKKNKIMVEIMNCVHATTDNLGRI